MSSTFATLPMEVVQNIAVYFEDIIDMRNFKRVCRSTHRAVEAPGFWRARFKMQYDMPANFTNAQLKLKLFQYGRAKLLCDMRDILRFRYKYLGDRSPSITNPIIPFHHPQEDIMIAVRNMLIEAFSERPTKRSRTIGGLSSDQEGWRKFPMQATDIIYDPQSTPLPSKNLQVLRNWVDETNLIENTFAPPAILFEDMHLQDAIQMTMAAWILQGLPIKRGLATPVHNIAFSQMMCYTSLNQQPIFYTPEAGQTSINATWISHCLNFWRFHMNSSEGSLHDAMHHLTDDLHPTMWKTALHKDVPINGRWMGSFAYLEQDEVLEIRLDADQEEPTQVYVDSVGGDSVDFQDVDFQEISPKEITWPPMFEQELRSARGPYKRVGERFVPADMLRSAARAGGVASSEEELVGEGEAPETVRFSGTGADAELPLVKLFGEEREQVPERVRASAGYAAALRARRGQLKSEDSQLTAAYDRAFCALGHLQALPHQFGVPGFRRFTMMKYFITANEFGEQAIDQAAMWAHEGVMLPGSRIILGRWWRADGDPFANDSYSGPFILWKASDPCECPDGDCHCEES